MFLCAQLGDGELSSFQVPMASRTEKERERHRKDIHLRRPYFSKIDSLLKKTLKKQGEEQIMLGRFDLLENLSFPKVCQNSHSSVCLKSPPVGEKWRLTWLFSRSQNPDSDTDSACGKWRRLTCFWSYGQFSFDKSIAIWVQGVHSSISLCMWKRNTWKIVLLLLSFVFFMHFQLNTLWYAWLVDFIKQTQ